MSVKVTPKKLRAVLEFANRFEADLDAMHAEGVTVPSVLQECARELSCLAGDVSCNGHLGKVWGEDGPSPADALAQRAGLRVIIAAATELEMYLKLVEAEPPQSE